MGNRDGVCCEGQHEAADRMPARRAGVARSRSAPHMHVPAAGARRHEVGARLPAEGGQRRHRAGDQYFLGDKDWRRKLVLFNAIRGNEQFLGVPPESRGLWKTSDKQFYWSTVSTIWHSDSSPARCGIGWEPPTGLFIFSVQDMLYRCLFLQEPTSVSVHRYWPRDVLAFCICPRQ